MKNHKRNWYRISFVLSCTIWAIFSVCVLFYKLNFDQKIQNQNEPFVIEEIEENETYYSKATTYAAKENFYFFEISEEDRYIIECIVAGESKGESLKGKKLVAQCIMNAMIRNNWNAEAVRIEYQYAGWDPDLENSNPDVWAQVELAISEVFDKGNLETYEPILYFYNPNMGYSKFHEEKLTYVLTEGGHKFFKLPGE